MDGQRPIDKARLSEERRQSLGELPSHARERRPGPPPLRRGGRLRQVRPGRRGEPGAIVLSEPRFAPPRAKLPGLRRVDEMQHDRLEPAFEVEQEKVAHEIEARRQRREIAFERGVERVLLHERIALRLVAQRLGHALRQLLGPPRGAVDRHEPGVEVGRIERKPERAARALELARQRVALEVHEKDHVISGGERLVPEIEALEPLEARADDQHVGIDGDDPLEHDAGRISSRNRRRNTAREKRPLPARFGVEAREVEGHELDALAQGRRQLVEAGRHVVRLADEENLALDVGFGLDQGRDRAHSRRKERAVRREAIGGSHGPPFQRRRSGRGRLTPRIA